MDTSFIEYGMQMRKELFIKNDKRVVKSSYLRMQRAHCTSALKGAHATLLSAEGRICSARHSGSLKDCSEVSWHYSGALSLAITAKVLLATLRPLSKDAKKDLRV